MLRVTTQNNKAQRDNKVKKWNWLQKTGKSHRLPTAPKKHTNQLIIKNLIRKRSTFS
jgi:hypothetical protein